MHCPASACRRPLWPRLGPSQPAFRPPRHPLDSAPLLASQIAMGGAITVSASQGTINLSREQAANSIHFWCVFNYRHNCCDGMSGPSTRALKVEGTVRINQVSHQQSRSLCHMCSVIPLHDGEQCVPVYFPSAKDTLIVSQRKSFFVSLTYDLSGGAAWMLIS